MLPTAPLQVPLRLETDRLLLRLPEEKDLPDFAAFNADPATMHFLGGTLPTGLGGWRGLSATLGHWALRGFGFYSVIEKHSGAWIGRIGFLYPDTWPCLELGWGIHSAHWGKGYAPEAALAVRAHRPTGQRLVSCIDPENHPSQRVAEKLGCRPMEEVTLFGEFRCIAWEHPPA